LNPACLSGHGGDVARGDLADPGAAVTDHEVAVRINNQAARHAERRGRGRPAVSGAAGFAKGAAGHRGDDSGLIDAPDVVIGAVGEVDPAGGIEAICPGRDTRTEVAWTPLP
jgi:hypothetical protein